MTGDFVDFSHLNVSKVQHPVLRMYCKFARECLFACHGNHLLRTGDLNILLRYLKTDQTVPNVHIPLLIWKHLVHISKGGSSTPIHVGGLVTRIASFYNIADQSEAGDARCLFTLDHLRRSSFLNDIDPVVWRVNAENERELPDPTLTEVKSTSQHFMIHGQPAAPRQQPRQPEQPGATYQAPEGFPQFQQQVMDAFGRLEVGIQNLNNRIDIFETDTQRALWPMYHYAYQQGYVPHTQATPSWYHTDGSAPMNTGDFSATALAQSLFGGGGGVMSGGFPDSGMAGGSGGNGGGDDEMNNDGSGVDPNLFP